MDMSTKLRISWKRSTTWKTRCFGGILNSLMRNADRIKLACLAQLVNVIAPIATNAKGLLRQSIYYPYSWALQWARGNVLNVLVESPAYEVAEFGQVPYLDVAGTLSSEDGKTSLFILNRDLAKSRAVEINWQGLAPGKLLTSTTLTPYDRPAMPARRAGGAPPGARPPANRPRGGPRP